MSRLDELIAELCPDGVKYKKVGDVCRVIRGKRLTIKELHKNGKYPVIHGGTTPMGFYSIPNRKAETTIVINTGNAGSVFFIDREFWSSDACFSLYPCSEVIDKFLYFYISSKESVLKSKIRVGAMPTIDSLAVESLIMPIPPLPVQHEIVRVLDNFTEYIMELTEKLTAELNARKKQYEYIYAQTINSAGMDNVDEVMLQDVSEFVTVGIANSATHAYADEGVIMFRNQNIGENYLDDEDLIYIKPEFSQKYKSKELKEKDILVTRTGYPGQACTVPAKYSGSQTFTTLIVRLKDFEKTDPDYICYYINSPLGKKYVNKMKAGAAQQNFGAKALEKMIIRLPSIELQKSIVQRIKTINEKHDNLTQTLSNEINHRQKQYEYYRNQLLSFQRRA